MACVKSRPVHEHFCELLPEEDPTLIDGHLLVVLLDGSQLSGAFAEYCERRVTRLSDRAEFQMALVDASDFKTLARRSSEFPAIFHFACGREARLVVGIDDCLEFLREFILNNKRQ